MITVEVDFNRILANTNNLPFGCLLFVLPSFLLFALCPASPQLAVNLARAAHRATCLAKPLGSPRTPEFGFSCAFRARTPATGLRRGAPLLDEDQERLRLTTDGADRLAFR